MGKCPWGDFCAVFGVFYSTTNIFLRLIALSISNISLQKCYRESFTANSYFPLKTQKFYPVDVFPQLYGNEADCIKVHITYQLVRIANANQRNCLKDHSRFITQSITMQFSPLPLHLPTDFCLHVHTVAIVATCDQ